MAEENTAASRTIPSPDGSPYSIVSRTSIRHTWLLEVNTDVAVEDTEAKKSTQASLKNLDNQEIAIIILIFGTL